MLAEEAILMNNKGELPASFFVGLALFVLNPW